MASLSVSFWKALQARIGPIAPHVLRKLQGPELRKQDTDAVLSAAWVEWAMCLSQAQGTCQDVTGAQQEAGEQCRHLM